MLITVHTFVTTSRASLYVKEAEWLRNPVQFQELMKKFFLRLARRMRVQIGTISTAVNAYVPRPCWLFSNAGVTSLSHPISMISRAEMKLNKDTLCHILATDVPWRCEPLTPRRPSVRFPPQSPGTVATVTDGHACWKPSLWGPRSTGTYAHVPSVGRQHNLLSNGFQLGTAALTVSLTVEGD